MKRIQATIIFVALGLAVQGAQGQSSTRVYRGSVGDSHIQMRLSFSGSSVSGSYAYDSVGDNLKLTGNVDAQGRLELKEFDAKNKQTGKFVCKRRPVDATDPECSWSKPDGTREALVSLEEQNLTLSSGIQISPKVISDRKKGVGVSYPQITSDQPLSPGAQSFNRRILNLTREAIGQFEPIEAPGNFDINYNVLLATSDLVSVEMSEYADARAAHPTQRFWSLTYDLTANKELKFEDLFKPESDYNTALAKYVVADIDRRADEFEKENARLENRQPKQRDEPIISMEQLSELSGWAMTPKGIVVYFDFPHVIAVFDKTFVPYGVIREHLKPNGPAARFQ